MAKKLGYTEDQVIMPDFDATTTFYSNLTFDTKFHISFRKILIDGFGIGVVGTTVLRDRKLLAQDGMFSVVLLVNKESGKLDKEPVVLSRGFVFMKENTDLINFLKQDISEKFNQVTSTPANFDFIREELQGHIEELIYQKTGRQPMVLPLVIEV
jgi:ribonuclease J